MNDFNEVIGNIAEAATKEQDTEFMSVFCMCLALTHEDIDDYIDLISAFYSYSSNKGNVEKLMFYAGAIKRFENVYLTCYSRIEVHYSDAFKSGVLVTQKAL